MAFVGTHEGVAYGLGTMDGIEWTAYFEEDHRAADLAEDLLGGFADQHMAANAARVHIDKALGMVG